MQENQGFFYIIPAILAEGGKPQKALLYGLITSLARKDGVCTATNDYLAKKLGKKNIGNISNLVKDLENDGWIETEIIDNFKREIRLNVGMCRLTKNHKGAYEKSEGGAYEKPQDSNISISNINSINVITPKQEAREFFGNEEKQKKLAITEILISKGMPQEVAEYEIKKFIDYWTEPNGSGTKQKWELERTFEISRRLATWFKNYVNFNKQKTEKTFGDAIKL